MAHTFKCYPVYQIYQLAHTEMGYRHWVSILHYNVKIIISSKSFMIYIYYTCTCTYIIDEREENDRPLPYLLYKQQDKVMYKFFN